MLIELYVLPLKLPKVVVKTSIMTTAGSVKKIVMILLITFMTIMTCVHTIVRLDAFVKPGWFVILMDHVFRQNFVDKTNKIV